MDAMTFRREWTATRTIFVLSACLTLIVPSGTGLGEEKGLAAMPGIRLVMLDDCDSDFRTAPFDDAVILLTAEGRVARRIGGLNICEAIGGCRAVTASGDGTSLVVCENVAARITAYELATGNPLWSLPGKFTSAVVHRGVVYALESTGTVYGSEIVAIDNTGGILRQAHLGGQDIAADPNANILWLVGADIQRCDTNLNVQWRIDPILWCATSVDVAPDGSAWVAERDHSDVGGQDRLLQISPGGAILSVIPLDLSPFCVRVDPADHSLWVTGLRLRKSSRPYLSPGDWPRILRFRDDVRLVGTRTCKYSMQGKLISQLNYGGNSLDIDPSDGSVWIAGRSGVWHCSRAGAEIHTFDSDSAGQKWICVVPQGP